ncbi:MAG: malate synthase A [Lysobacterales bacterium]
MSGCRQATLDEAIVKVLSQPARDFLAELHRRFEPRRQQLLAMRRQRQSGFDAGCLPDFLPETAALRRADWRVAAIPEALLDRRVEITGPVDRKMIVNALNSGARVFMADFEDSSSPTWTAMIEGQINLADAIRRQIDFVSPEGKHYALKQDGLAILMVRPRGWHLDEKHFPIDARPIAGALFDFGLFVFHNAQMLAEQQKGPYFYLPKLQSHQEAALWEEVIAFGEVRLGLPIGTIKVTVLIETLPAAFEMDEILHALKSRIVGLNCGRWDYIFSYIKTFRAHPDRVLPERGQVSMAAPFLKAYAQLLIDTCHRRGALAMGGMAAQIPIAGDPEANAAALAKVRADKRREVQLGHDGTWVAHPGLIPVAAEVFDQLAPAVNQLDRPSSGQRVERDALITPCAGSISRTGFLNNIDVCVRYVAAWLDGLGCVPIHHLMEDAATAEISRAQLWQWLHVGGLRLDDGAAIDFTLFDQAIATVEQRVDASNRPGANRIREAAEQLSEWTHAEHLVEFLTLPCYSRLP